MPVPRAYGNILLHHEKDQIHIVQGRKGGLVHIFPEPCAGFMEARSIEENHLGAFGGSYHANDIAGGLGLVADNGELLAHQGV